MTQEQPMVSRDHQKRIDTDTTPGIPSKASLIEQWILATFVLVVVYALIHICVRIYIRTYQVMGSQPEDIELSTITTEIHHLSAIDELTLPPPALLPSEHTRTSRIRQTVTYFTRHRRSGGVNETPTAIPNENPPGTRSPPLYLSEESLEQPPTLPPGYAADRRPPSYRGSNSSTSEPPEPSRTRLRPWMNAWGQAMRRSC
jgi:hypothetical protein